MSDTTHAAVLVAAMSAGTILLRFLPFMLFKKKVPRYVNYLGKVLPAAIIGMLVIYCLRNTAVLSSPFGIPELISVLIVIVLQVWRRNSLLSILSGTAAYMLLVQLLF